MFYKKNRYHAEIVFFVHINGKEKSWAFHFTDWQDQHDFASWLVVLHNLCSVFVCMLEVTAAVATIRQCDNAVRQCDSAAVLLPTVRQCWKDSTGVGRRRGWQNSRAALLLLGGNLSNIVLQTLASVLVDTAQYLAIWTIIDIIKNPNSSTCVQSPGAPAVSSIFCVKVLTLLHFWYLLKNIKGINKELLLVAWLRSHPSLLVIISIHVGGWDRASLVSAPGNSFVPHGNQSWRCWSSSDWGAPSQIVVIANHRVFNSFLNCCGQHFLQKKQNNVSLRPCCSGSVWRGAGAGRSSGSRKRAWKRNTALYCVVARTGTSETRESSETASQQAA